ncbi:hypothetical protein [Sutterella wadsworthensis]|nr:hypothetical protein [Sutterella wadsworthensis]MCB7456995.1 hypothetical protein [Sutterella wadsworthensis]
MPAEFLVKSPEVSAAVITKQAVHTDLTGADVGIFLAQIDPMKRVSF